ncbi:hypothetical protein [Euzebyella saccharophila]|uniref:Uncharacterized protein n=1 Tax=Euzebyella saccharophila TaxID=679664 RepID=A0ABV8JTF4_9FLAO|nr:hypothetical protein [Euzebyella saccharophila]
MESLEHFSLGDLVVFKTHPLIFDFRIKGDGKLVPPILLICEVIFERAEKVIRDEMGNRVADKIKYKCKYFDDAKSEFVEVILYHSLLVSFDKLKIEKLSKEGETYRNDQSLIEEIKGYKIPEYKYGKIVLLKSKKIEMYKKRELRKFTRIDDGVESFDVEVSVQYSVNYTSPDFVLCGYKSNESQKVAKNSSKSQNLRTNVLYKVKWFNPFKQKFSEEFLPKECLTDC